jgi:signal transduction histidine kinase
MTELIEVLQQYGQERVLSPGEVLIRQGSESDGVYYLKTGKLGAYREESDGSYSLSEIEPGKLVGELAAATGWPRTVTVKAEEESRVLHVSQVDFHRALRESPALTSAVVSHISERLTDADVARVSLGRGYRRVLDRVDTLKTEKAQLEELLRLREELADMIVHDLRNPLGVIIGGLEMLDGVSVAEADAEYAAAVLRAIRKSSERMHRLVDTLLDIARLEEGAMDLQIVALDSWGLVEETVTAERPLAEAKDITLENRVEVALPAFLADRDILQRILINLLDNALKFTPVGGRVWVEGRLRDGAIALSVVDTGRGIPPEERERIFEKFTQVRGQQTTRKGSGLGLTFCQMAVEAQGGRIWVEDGPQGRGSRFTFTIPSGSGGAES